MNKSIKLILTTLLLCGFLYAGDGTPFIGHTGNYSVEFTDDNGCMVEQIYNDYYFFGIRFGHKLQEEHVYCP